MKWLIQDIHEGDQKLFHAVNSLGLEAEMLSVKDLYTKDLSTKEPVCVHASTWGVQHLMDTYGFKTLAPFDRLRCQVYYAYWGEYLLNNYYTMLPLGDVLRRYEDILVQLGAPTDDLFLRPDTNDKLFVGGVYTPEDIERFLRGDMPPETLVLASPAYKIDAEWRFIMHNGKVVTGSLYREHGELFSKEDITPKEFAESIPMYPGLPPVYVLDIALCADNYYVIETGTVNCAGFYACDLQKIVEVMTLETELAYASM